MNLYRKNIAVFLLLAIGCLPLILTVTLHIKQIVIQSEMHQRLKLCNLQTLVLPVAAIPDAQNCTELTINGNLFDVSNIQKSGENYLVTGLYDKEETTINKLLEKQMFGNGTNKSSIFSKPFFFLFYPINTPSGCIHQISCNKRKESFPVYSSYLSVVLPIQSPPPKIACTNFDVNL